MKTLFTIALIATVSFCFGQSKDSLKAKQFQIVKLTKSDSTIRVHQKHFTDMLELIFGCKIEEVESWSIENGYFKWKLKPKKK